MEPHGPTPHGLGHDEGGSALPSHASVARPRRFLPKVRHVSVAFLLATGFLALGPARADAYPTGCSAERWFASGARARCTGGTGSYRVKFRCDKSLGFDYDRAGPWKAAGSGEWSTAGCNVPDHPFNIVVEAFGPN
jgi:hypothetical protein